MRKYLLGKVYLSSWHPHFLLHNSQCDFSPAGQACTAYSQRSCPGTLKPGVFLENRSLQVSIIFTLDVFFKYRLHNLQSIRLLVLRKPEVFSKSKGHTSVRARRLFRNNKSWAHATTVATIWQLEWQRNCCLSHFCKVF